MATQAEISFLPEAFELSNGINKYQILWNDIIKILAYKADLWSEDEIWLDISTSYRRTYTISEEFHNWIPFVDAIEKKFLIDHCWLGDVMLPPFKRNETVIYERCA